MDSINETSGGISSIIRKYLRGKYNDKTTLETIELIKKYKKARNPQIKEDLKERIVTNNLKLVANVINRKFSNVPPFIDQADLMQAGIEGLIKALEGFDVKRNVKFSTYAFFIIFQYCQNEMRNGNIFSFHHEIWWQYYKYYAHKKEFDKVEDDLKSYRKLLRKYRVRISKAKIDFLNSLKQENKFVHLDNDIYTDFGIKDKSKEDIFKQSMRQKIRKDLIDIIKKLESRKAKIMFLRYFSVDKFGENFSLERVASFLKHKQIKGKIYTKERIRQLQEESLNFVKNEFKEKYGIKTKEDELALLELISKDSC